MKKFLEKNDWWKYIGLLVFLSIIGFIGVFYSPENTRWVFIFENMAWLPFELGLTIFAINKILELTDSKREKERFRKLTRTDVKSLIVTLKYNLAGIVSDDSTYDSSRDVDAIFHELATKPELLITDDLIKSNRTYSTGFDGKTSKSIKLNFDGIKFLKLKSIDEKLQNFLNRYSIYMEDNFMEDLINLINKTQNIGMLKKFSSIQINHTSQYKIDEGSIDYLKNELSDYSEQVVKFVEKLQSI